MKTENYGFMSVQFNEDTRVKFSTTIYFLRFGLKILENDPVHYTEDMNRTFEWFENVLGQYGSIDARGENGKGIFGGISLIPNEITEKRN